MTKVRKSITISPELAQLVDDHDEFNLSGFCERALEEYFAGGSAAAPEQAALQAELERLEEDIELKEMEQSKLRSRREEIESRLEELNSTDEIEGLAQAAEQLEGTPKDPTNPAIKNWASKLGITGEQLCDRLEKREVQQ